MKNSYHVHSLWSDGSSSLEEIFLSAKKLKLDELGISDHYALMPKGIRSTWSMDPSSLDDYIKDVQSLFGREIPVRLGIEADFIPETLPKLSSILKARPFDYVLGSIHVIDDVIIDERKMNLDSYVKRYWELVFEMAESGQFDIVSHIDLTKKYGYQPTIDLSCEIEKALSAIAKANMTVELNTSGWFYPCKEQYPSSFLLQKCKEKNISVMINADAHDPKDLTRGFDLAGSLLKTLGFTQRVRYEKRKKIFFNF